MPLPGTCSSPLRGGLREARVLAEKHFLREIHARGAPVGAFSNARRSATSRRGLFQEHHLLRLRALPHARSVKIHARSHRDSVLVATVPRDRVRAVAANLVE